MSPILGAAAIIGVAAIVVTVLVVLTANAQEAIAQRGHPSCSNNPGYNHGEPPHHCPGAIRAQPSPQPAAN